MEPHVPHQPIRSFKEFVNHIAVVTVGVLIALLFENLAESVHQRHRLSEARQALIEEIEYNRHLLQNDANFPYHRAYLAKYAALHESGKVEGADAIFDHGLHPPLLRDTAWRAFVASDVAGRMPFPDRMILGGIYRDQEDLDYLFRTAIAGFLSPRSDRESTAYRKDEIGILAATLSDVAAIEQRLTADYDRADAALRKE